MATVAPVINPSLNRHARSVTLHLNGLADEVGCFA
jgi:hypothetical protein